MQQGNSLGLWETDLRNYILVDNSKIKQTYRKVFDKI